MSQRKDNEDNGVRHDYLPAGNVNRTPGTRYGYLYDARGRLSQVNDGKKTAIVYTYDYQHRRTSRSPGGRKYGSAVVYHYDTGGHLIAETTPAGAPLRSYVWRDDTVVAQIEHQPARAVLYLESDYLDTVRAARNSAGQVVWRWESDAFGALSADTDPDRDRRNTTVNLRFPGQIADEVNPTVYNWHRYYEPSSGRYVTSDPIGLAGGLNTYVYVHNNPLSYIDPLGLAVGDWWDFPANFDRAREIAREELARRPRPHNDMGDAMRHSEWMRRTTQETNACTAWIAGTGHEIEGLLSGQPWAEAIMDLHNNAVGRNAGSNNMPFDPSKLWTLPTNGSTYNPYRGVR